MQNNQSHYDLKVECINIITNYQVMMSGDVLGCINGTDFLLNPYFRPSLLMELAKAVGEIFKSEPIVIRSNEPIIIIGDIHGHLFDLARIFINFGFPPSQRYLFLGDLVDRGEFSTECITFIYALKYLYPNHILIIRGNHEFSLTSASGGFSDEIETIYPNCRLFNYFIDSFQYMPLSVILYNKIICVHGGPCPELQKVSQLDAIERPIPDYENPLICGILWSDPSFNIPSYMPSRRGTGWLFGDQALADFLEANNLSVLIRGHECVSEGYEKCFDGQLITVFSASNYCGALHNKAAVLCVSGADKIEPVTMEPIGYMKRTSSKHVNPLKITMQELNNMKVPDVLRISSLIVGNVINPNKPLFQHLNVRKRLNQLTRRRTHSACISSQFFIVEPFFNSFDA
ncbi:Serine/threonine-protein phosphatase PP1 isozyme 9 [Tritrichomonas foetus]|uniref:Serine/threonine-protein phosphatase n=1 Tax=Tritrichomonas foetus TaxID=1144522 RepID=A0A1J4JPM8_9EUKA|nr:Serine/threonine-protein phosphatase PP1 isozyme 9 [Tritrichomonas foetus]|eukprot:OHS99220.1 Serine/threonine-protein phosphatase PP1 isozyme 9 [Tritrichomonas foetus]